MNLSLKSNDFGSELDLVAGGIAETQDDSKVLRVELRMMKKNLESIYCMKRDWYLYYDDFIFFLQPYRLNPFAIVFWKCPTSKKCKNMIDNYPLLLCIVNFINSQLYHQRV